jgi:hypothetical protein
MKEIERQSSKVDIQVGDRIYSLKPLCEGPYELGDKLADQIYIRLEEVRYGHRAKNLGFKADNIKVKDHIFFTMSMILTGMVPNKWNITI